MLREHVAPPCLIIPSMRLVASTRRGLYRLISIKSGTKREDLEKCKWMDELIYPSRYSIAYGIVIVRQMGGDFRFFSLSVSAEGKKFRCDMGVGLASTRIYKEGQLSEGVITGISRR